MYLIIYRKKWVNPIDQLDLIKYIIDTNNEVNNVTEETYNERQNHCNQNGSPHLQVGSQMKLIVLILLVALGVVFPPITLLYAIIGLIYLAKVVAK